MIPDIINALFEGFAGLFILNHCRVLYRDKQVKGVSIVSTIFFTLWGFWNIFYYPSLGQMWSFYGGLLVVGANALWVAMQLHYSLNEGGKGGALA